MKHSPQLKKIIGLGCTIAIFSSPPSDACPQSIMDEISRTSKLMGEFLTANSKCTSIGANSDRSRCWQKNPLTTEELDTYKSLDDKYVTLLTSCKLDSIKYNLGNFRQSFGFECDATELFSDINESSRYRDDRIMADAALQCAINSKGTELFEEKRAELRELISTIVERNYGQTSERKNKTGRLLGVWRDYFSLGAESHDSSSIASSIHSNDIEWESWTMFLVELRRHLVSWRGSLFPNRDTTSITSKQYDLSVSKLTK